MVNQWTEWARHAVPLPARTLVPWPSSLGPGPRPSPLAPVLCNSRAVLYFDDTGFAVQQDLSCQILLVYKACTGGSGWGTKGERKEHAKQSAT